MERWRDDEAMRWEAGVCACSKGMLSRATRNEERGRLLNATKGQLRDEEIRERGSTPRKKHCLTGAANL